jgi:hypothetical protein
MREVCFAPQDVHLVGSQLVLKLPTGHDMSEQRKLVRVCLRSADNESGRAFLQVV